ncbi:ABC transporter ATP-binding protein [Streptomyces sp. ISL-111]|uniref:ABC transporter ATP-binding protein n=1 Tax=unclassified Streptomyces TaxID=2593676 RepID=UPI001BE83875|nr:MULTISPECIES: ABC transporter ATP-binding protein [unclassified Streptomyces]MBT2381794.1 ABC transporter ATP-binding protein [Streptomyces sp. ISL-111]MBT2430179.1 ABC transporter ATP-binding protein [Streptomyces sp. ISL-112]MBT2465810.1 ABC transporter ATP-binding protein [Streptomyces sp. ISL-63]
MTADPKQTPSDFRTSALRLLRSLGPDRPTLAVCLALSLVSVALSVSVPMILGHVTDLVVQGVGGGRVDFAQVGRILLGAAVLVLVSAACALGRGRMAQALSQRAAHRLREQASAKTARLPLSYFDKRTRGEVLSRVTQDVDNIALTLQQLLTKIVVSVLSVIGVLGMMLWLSPLLTLIAVVMLPLAAWVTRGFGKRAQPRFAEQQAATGHLNSHIEEMYTGHDQILLFGRAEHSKRAFDERNDAQYAAGHRAQFLSGVIEPVMAFLGHLNFVLIAVIGGLRVAAGAMSIGDIQAFITYTLQFNNPITQSAALANIVQSGVASAERVFELLDAVEQEPDPLTPARPQQVRGRVAFEHVAFRYEPAKPLIEDLSLTVEPHHTIAIVGPTGAGKTTLVNLLLRFYEPTGGRITLDGTDIASMSRAELRGHIGMVLQDTWLFEGTIADNIAYGVQSASRDEIVRAGRAARADHFIRTLPEGYDTLIDEDGGGLSAGERQLLTIARAFLTKPSILVLDEATSSVDTRTEALVQRAMADLRQGRTSFVIAHRLSTIRDADTILVMEDGRIAEQGTHSRLLAAGGVYARLHAAQFTSAPTTPEPA